MSKGITLSRCHWCATESCDNFGKYRTVEGGCRYFTLLDPLLRKSRIELLEGLNGRRLRKKFTASISAENVTFLMDVILPSNPNLYGHLTRAIGLCVGMIVDHLDGAIPPVPKDIARTGTQQCSITLLPPVYEAVDAIVQHYKGTNDEVARSQVVDYFISIVREKSGH